MSNLTGFFFFFVCVWWVIFFFFSDLVSFGLARGLARPAGVSGLAF